MAFNFVPNDAIAYVSYRKFHDFWEDISQFYLQLTSIFALTTIDTGRNAVSCNNQMCIEPFCTQGNYIRI